MAGAARCWRIRGDAAWAYTSRCRRGCRGSGRARFRWSSRARITPSRSSSAIERATRRSSRRTRAPTGMSRTTWNGPLTDRRGERLRRGGGGLRRVRSGHVRRVCHQVRRGQRRIPDGGAGRLELPLRPCRVRGDGRGGAGGSRSSGGACAGRRRTPWLAVREARRRAASGPPLDRRGLGLG